MSQRNAPLLLKASQTSPYADRPLVIESKAAVVNPAPQFDSILLAREMRAVTPNRNTSNLSSRGKKQLILTLAKINMDRSRKHTPSL